MMQITIAGNITRDAEVKSLQDGSVTTFSVAVNKKVKGQDVTTFFDVSLWGRRGEALAQYLTKGGKVTVAGEFGTREHNGKTYMQIRANDVALQGGKPREQQSGASQGYGQQGGYGGGIEGDEIPFLPERRI